MKAKELVKLIQDTFKEDEEVEFAFPDYSDSSQDFEFSTEVKAGTHKWHTRKGVVYEYRESEDAEWREVPSEEYREKRLELPFFSPLLRERSIGVEEHSRKALVID